MEPYLHLSCGKNGMLYWQDTSLLGALTFHNSFPTPVEIIVRPLRTEKKEEEMRQEVIIAAAPQQTESEHQRRYLLDELEHQYYDHKSSLQKSHGLIDDDAPRTWKEFLKRIEDGHFQYDKSKDEDHEHWNIASHIRWRDPAKKEDKAGYNTAKDALKKRFKKAKDSIMVLDLEKGLKAKQEFETLH